MVYFPSLTLLALISVVNIVFGFVWYNDNVWGHPWRRALDLDMKPRPTTGKMLTSVAGGFISYFLTAFVLSYFLKAWHADSLPSAFEVAFWLWLGFSAQVVVGSVLWEQRSYKLFLINGFYYLLQLLLMAAMMIFLQPYFEAQYQVSPQDQSAVMESGE